MIYIENQSVDALLEDKDDWDFEGSRGLDEVERVRVERRFCYLQTSCRIMRRKVPGTVTKEVKLADAFVKQRGESVERSANNSAPVTLPSAGTKVVSISANIKTTLKKAVRGIAELDSLRAAAEVASEEHNVVWAKRREEWQDELEACRRRHAGAR